jgi:hypothetical protein
MNALKAKLFNVAIAACLSASAAFAAVDSITVTFAQPVTLGSVTLPGGQYQVSESATSNGNWFVFRSDKGETVAALASKTADAAPDQKTEVVLSHEGGALHVDKLFIEGDSAGYQFPESK